MSKLKPVAGLVLSLLIAIPPDAIASSHREAPVTALDHTADITDFYAFVSYDHPDRATFIMNVDPFLQPSNGPNYFPFDPSIVYQILIDNNQTALPAVVFRFQFQTNILSPGLPVIYPLPQPWTPSWLRRSGQRIERTSKLAESCLPRHADRASRDHVPERRRGCGPESAADVHGEHDQGRQDH